MTEYRRILAVDDEPAILAYTAQLLRSEGHHVVTADSGDEAVPIVQSQEFNLIITDLEMPGLSWETLLKRLLTLVPDTPVMLLTAHGSIEDQLELINKGAFDVVSKPYNDKDFLLRVTRALRHNAMKIEVRELRLRLSREEHEMIVGDEEVMRRLLDHVTTVAATDFPVLLTGESGVGKEMVARYLHRLSPRVKGPFIAVNCPAVPGQLFESEFFGHVRGAFTGAHTDRKGLFEAAEGGTIFLDEVSEVTLDNQVKLLRVLQGNEVKRVGDTASRRVDVRLICATNRDLRAAVREGSFREDLYYRINVFPVQIPPLRERRGDILTLARHFIGRAQVELGHDLGRRLSKGAIARMMAYAWPGNVRQLENVIRQAMIRSSGEWIEAEDLALEEDGDNGLAPANAGVGPDGRPVPAGPQEILPFSDARERWTRHYLETLLRHVHGNVSRAAEVAGKHRSELYELLNRFAIDPGRFRGRGGDGKPDA